MSAPNTILILGTGVFGLTTAQALLANPEFAQTKLILVSPEVNSVPSASTAKTASVDSTRIIRADYADRLYSELGQEAHKSWREGDCGRNGRYTEAGLMLTVDEDTADAKQYVDKSFKNVQQKTPHAVHQLRNREEIADAMRAPGKACGSGSSGYINTGSGWADAEACMRWLMAEVVKMGSGRVEFLQGEAVQLLHDPEASIVRGAKLSSGEEVTADLTILATGAWTPKLLDMRGVASSRAQVMAYYTLSEAEAEALGSIPVHLNMGSGRFLFPPTKRSDGQFEIKAARHTFGYSNLVRIPAPLGAPRGETEITTSLPDFPLSGIPQIDAEPLTAFLHSSLPILASHPRKPFYSRLCHYLDTPKGDFLVCYHPAYNKSLFLATGGSGHAFKFLPVLGKEVVGVLEEGLDSKATPNSKWAEKWSWPQSREQEDEVWCSDGSRSGIKGSTLQEAMAMNTNVIETS